MILQNKDRPRRQDRKDTMNNGQASVPNGYINHADQENTGTNCFVSWNEYEITYPFPNFNGATVEVWKWIGNFISYFSVYVITLSMLGLKLIHVVKEALGDHWCCYYPSRHWSYLEFRQMVPDLFISCTK